MNLPRHRGVNDGKAQEWHASLLGEQPGETNAHCHDEAGSLSEQIELRDQSTNFREARISPIPHTQQFEFRVFPGETVVLSFCKAGSCSGE